MNNAYLSQDEANALNLSSPAAQLSGLGDKLKTALSSGVQFGKKFYVDATNGSDDNDGLSLQTAFRTFKKGYDALTANKNEVLYLVGGSSGVLLTAAVDWAKSYTHLVGIGGNVRFGGRCRITHTGTAMAKMFTVSGNGCIFQNIHWQHGEASATNLVCVSVSGLRNFFVGCHFEASLDTVASGSTYAWRAVQLEVAAQANTFNGCTFGSWTTVWASANGKLMHFMGDNADTFTEDCVFVINTSSTSMVPVGFEGVISGANSYVMFIGCKFIATNAKPAVIFGIPTNGWIFLEKSAAFNVTAWSTTNAKLIEANGAANASGTGIGVAQA